MTKNSRRPWRAKDIIMRYAYLTKKDRSSSLKIFTLGALILMTVLLQLIPFYELSPIFSVKGSISDGAYPIEWCTHLDGGDSLTYRITNVEGNSPFEVDSLVIAIIESLPEKVDNGYYGNLACEILYNNEKISPFSIPPFLVPKYVFRACCNAYKPLVYQLQDWGWKNFSLVYEDDEVFKLNHTTDDLESEILYNYDGIALSFNATVNSTTGFSGELLSQISNPTSESNQSSWGSITSLVLISLVIFRRKRRQ